MLGVIKCGVHVASRINGFLVVERPSKPPLVDGPLIAYDPQSSYEPHEMADLVSQALQQQQDLGNPIIGQYLTMLERITGAGDSVAPSAAGPSAAAPSANGAPSMCNAPTNE